MDLEIVMLSEDREGEILYDILYMWNLKGSYTNELFTKQRQTHRFREWIYGFQGWRMGVERIGIWVPMHTLFYLKWITNKGLLHSRGNSAQYYVVAWMGRELGENGYMHMYGQIPLQSTETMTTLLISYTPSRNITIVYFQFNYFYIPYMCNTF